MSNDEFDQTLDEKIKLQVENIRLVGQLGNLVNAASIVLGEIKMTELSTGVTGLYGNSRAFLQMEVDHTAKMLREMIVKDKPTIQTGDTPKI